MRLGRAVGEANRSSLDGFAFYDHARHMLAGDMPEP